MGIYLSNEAHSVRYVNKKMRLIFGEAFTINLRLKKGAEKIRLDVLRRMFGMSVQYQAGFTKESRVCSKNVEDYITKTNEIGDIVDQRTNVSDIFMNKAEFMLYSKHVSTDIFGGTSDWILAISAYSDENDLVDKHAYNNLLYSMMRSNANLHFMMQDYNERKIKRNYDVTARYIRRCWCSGYWSYSYYISPTRNKHYNDTIKDSAERYNSFVISLKNCFDVIREIALYQNDTSKRNMAHIDDLFNNHLKESFVTFQKEILQLNSEIDEATKLSESTMVALVTSATLVDQIAAQNAIDTARTRNIVSELDETEMTKIVEHNIASYRRDTSSIVGALINKYHETARIWKLQGDSIKSMITLDLRYKDKHDGKFLTYHKDEAIKKVANKVAAKRAVTNASSGFVLGLTASFLTNNFGRLMKAAKLRKEAKEAERE